MFVGDDDVDDDDDDEGEGGVEEVKSEHTKKMAAHQKYTLDLIL